jgi:hypothetical protein
MGFPGKTKDNRKARHDLVELYNRPSLELKVNGGKPCTSFCSIEERSNAVDKGVEIPRWLHCWLETISEYGDREVEWVEES